MCWLVNNFSVFVIRFFKLHERKCEPIVMTVPRKVSPHPQRKKTLSCLLNYSSLIIPAVIMRLPQFPHLTNLSFVFSRTCSKTTCTQTRLDPILLWRLRSGSMARMKIPFSFPLKTAMYRSRTVNSRWSKRTFWTARWPRTRRTPALPASLPRRPQWLWVLHTLLCRTKLVTAFHPVKLWSLELVFSLWTEISCFSRFVCPAVGNRKKTLFFALH